MVNNFFYFINIIEKYILSEKGASAVEYAILIVCIAIVIVAIVSLIGPTLVQFFEPLIAALSRE